MIIGLVIILLVILTLPFVVKKVEHNLEIFLFIMGALASTVSQVMSSHLVIEIFENKMLYFITAAVLIAGILFKFTVEKIRVGMDIVTHKVSLPIIMFFIIVVLGLVSSIITAIIASLVLVEMAQALPIARKEKIRFVIIACFSIGLGAALTPIGEPLSTIVVSVLKQDFFFLIRTLGAYIIPGVIAMGLLGAILVGKSAKVLSKEELLREAEISDVKLEAEGFPEIFMRGGKIFLFIVALELLGAGFKPLINTYVIQLHSMSLYWINILSAVLDNATLAAAEISPMMSPEQVTAILMGLLISGGILIPGNIPNIISASKLHIGSREWAILGVPLGIVVLLIYFVILFLI
jgi:predicted cation transporter